MGWVRGGAWDWLAHEGCMRWARLPCGASCLPAAPTPLRAHTAAARRLLAIMGPSGSGEHSVHCLCPAKLRQPAAAMEQPAPKRPSQPPASPQHRPVPAVTSPHRAAPLAGKTTLLNALAGQLPRTKGMELRGSITVNGKPAARAKYQSGFVQQEDIFYSQLSVK